MKRALCLAFILLSSAAAARGPRIEPLSLLPLTVMPQGQMDRILALHNEERARFDAPPLVWDERLAREAHIWARDLAQSGRFEHSPASLRRGAGENLYMGTTGYFPPERMVREFLAERDDFRAGRFPDVARRGSWHDVGHYTQIIWRGTRQVGCALARARGQDVLVCRYWPAGNIFGQRVP